MARIKKSDRKETKPKQKETKNLSVAEKKQNNFMKIALGVMITILVLGTIAGVLFAILNKPAKDYFKDYIHVSTQDYLRIIEKDPNGGDINDQGFNVDTRKLLLEARDESKQVYFLVYSSGDRDKNFDLVEKAVEKYAKPDNTKSVILILIDLSSDGNNTNFHAKENNHASDVVNDKKSFLIILDWNEPTASYPVKELTTLSNYGNENRIANKIATIVDDKTKEKK